MMLDPTEHAFAKALATVYLTTRTIAARLDLALEQRGEPSRFTHALRAESLSPSFSNYLWSLLEILPQGKRPYEPSELAAMPQPRQSNRDALNTFALARNVMHWSNQEALSEIKDAIASAVDDGDEEFFRKLGGMLNVPRKKKGSERLGHAWVIRSFILPLQLYKPRPTSQLDADIRYAAALLGHKMPMDRRELLKVANREMRAFDRSLQKFTAYRGPPVDWEQFSKTLASETR